MQHSLSTEAKSPVQDSDDSSDLKEGLDEQFSAEPTKGDDQYDQEVESDTPATPTSIWSRIRKILLVLVAMWLALMILRGSANKRPKVIHATRFVTFIFFPECIFAFTPSEQVFGRLQVPTCCESRHH